MLVLVSVIRRFDLLLETSTFVQTDCCLSLVIWYEMEHVFFLLYPNQALFNFCYVYWVRINHPWTENLEINEYYSEIIRPFNLVRTNSPDETFQRMPDQTLLMQQRDSRVMMKSFQCKFIETTKSMEKIGQQILIVFLVFFLWKVIKLVLPVSFVSLLAARIYPVPA